MNIQNRLRRLEGQVEPEPQQPQKTGIIVINPGEALESALARLKQERPELAETPDADFTTIIQLVESPEEGRHEN